LHSFLDCPTILQKGVEIFGVIFWVTPDKTGCQEEKDNPYNDLQHLWGENIPDEQLPR
jgi:hypothetical protein